MTISIDACIDELGITNRSSNALKADGINYISDLLALSEMGLSKTPNLGRKSLAEVTCALFSHGLTLRDYKPRPKKKNFYVCALPEHHEEIKTFAAQLDKAAQSGKLDSQDEQPARDSCEDMINPQTEAINVYGSAEREVDRAIVTTILPLAYKAIDELIDAAGDRVPKELLIRSKRLLPSSYRNSFEKAKPHG